MTIACLGWGSLIWDPRDLPIESAWHGDGPCLPVEFARQSANGRLTLVLLEQGVGVPTLWASLRANDIAMARRALARREGIPEEQARAGVGSLAAPPGRTYLHSAAIARWAGQKSLDAVVWTALQPRFHGTSGRAPAASEAVGYMRALAGERRAVAEEYVRRAPAQVSTPYRALFEHELGWTRLEPGK